MKFIVEIDDEHLKESYPDPNDFSKDLAYTIAAQMELEVTVSREFTGTERS